MSDSARCLAFWVEYLNGRFVEGKGFGESGSMWEVVVGSD